MGNGSICMSEKNQSWCTIAEDCSQTGLSTTNIFGLFYNIIYPEKSCLYNDIQSSNPEKRYCYYDYFSNEASWTTVDKCLSCSTELTCFDYNSESACSQDNCLVGERTSQNCEWHTTYNNFQILGKGYCTPQEYTDTDHCSDCSPNSELFFNTECTNNICSALGLCYSKENNTACLDCTEETTCESYTTEDDCTGANHQKFNIPSKCKSSKDIQLSNDNCHLGRCTWKDNTCIKDGDNNGKEDCNGNIDCLKDNSAPTTNLADVPNYINKQGATLLLAGCYPI